MSRLAEALAWSGRDTTLSLFVIKPAGRTMDGFTRLVPTLPDAIRRYDLEDLDDRLPGWSCTEIDLIFEELPADLETIVRAWIGAALSSGATLVWFAFEGSFDLDHILTSDIADQVFAVGSAQGVYLAIDDEVRDGKQWARWLAHLRSKVLL